METMERLHISLFVLLFCSPLLSDGKTFFTHLNTPCTDDCKPDGGEYKCKTIDEDGRSQTMYCSPQENVDYWGRQCRVDSMCGKYGENYCWCRINIFSWGFCGLVKDDKNGTLITFRHRNKREPKVLETINDQNIHKRITISVEASGDFANSNSKLRKEAADLINQWDNSHLTNQASSNRIISDNLRIDMQGMINRDNKRYHNLQVQINVPRSRRFPSTTLSQVLIHDEGVPDEYVRRALLYSLLNNVRVFIDVSDI